MSEYAIRALIHLASQPSDSTVRINQMALEDDIPETFLRKIIPLLSKAGLVYSHRGTSGGIKLARSADAISLYDVFEAIEGRFYFNKCLISTDVCHCSEWCSVHLVWREVQDSVIGILSKKSLADLAKSNRNRKRKFESTSI